MGLHQPMALAVDAIVTALPDTPLIGFYADCVVTLLYDPQPAPRACATRAGAAWRAVSCPKPWT